ncbi:hypothetical protein, partial [Nakamurella sp.]|uniref:hypothetical protein n=1 Tax=Nakamurella sp. TaxID=1869182 RepID=UPI003784C80C
DDTPTVFEDPPVSFTFDRRQYEDLLAELRARFDPSEGDGSPPPGGPAPGGPAPGGPPPGGPPPGGPPPGGPAPGGPAPSEGSNRPAPRG